MVCQKKRAVSLKRYCKKKKSDSLLCYLRTIVYVFFHRAINTTIYFSYSLKYTYTLIKIIIIRDHINFLLHLMQSFALVAPFRVPSKGAMLLEYLVPPVTAQNQEF